MVNSKSMTNVAIISKYRIEAEERRQVILDAAEEVFLAMGFDAASMSAIASRIGGSKATLYQYFSSKAALFESCVRRRSAEIHKEVYASVPRGATAADALTSFGCAYLRLIASEENLRHLRVVIAAAERYPELGILFYESGPRHGAELLAERLSAWSDKGLIHVDEPLEAAQLFIGLCSHKYMLAALCGLTRSLNAAEVDAEVRAAVAIFLNGVRSYTTNKASVCS